MDELRAEVKALQQEVAALRGEVLSLRALVSPADFEDQFGYTDPRIVEDGA